MALVFVKTNDEGDDMKPLVIRSGSVLSADHLTSAPASSKDEVEEVMRKMTNDDIGKTLSRLGLKITGKPNKDKMIEMIWEKMGMLKAKASRASLASGDKKDEEKIPTSGERNLMQYLAKSYKDVKGFHCGYYEGGAFHIFTPYGMYSPDVDDSDGIEFIRNHNCLILSKEDMEELKGDESSDQSEDETKTGGYIADEPLVAKSSDETWTTSDEHALELLEVLNSGAIGMNTHELLALREKKQKFLEKTLEKDEEPNLDFFDFVGVSQGDWVNSGKTEHRRPDMNDFFDDRFMVQVFNNSGDILLMKVEADRKMSKIELLKCDIIECVEKIKKSKGELLEFGVDDFVLTRGAHNFKPYKDTDGIDGDKVYIHLKLRGGAKGQPVKKQSLKKSQTPTSRDDVGIFQDAFTCALSISSLTNSITLDKLTEQLTVEQLKKLLDNVEHGKDTMAVKLDKFAEESPAWTQLLKAFEKIEGAQIAMKTSLKDDIYKTCSQNDKFKKALLEKKLAVAIGVKEKLPVHTSSIDVQMTG